MDPYRWWQDELARVFFGPEMAGRPVVLYVDDEKAGKLRGDSVPELTAALQPQLDWSQRDIFDPVHRMIGPWRSSEQREPPPCLPLLAVCVLAATRMHRDQQVTSGNYYRRLLECLPTSGRAPEEAKQALQESYEQIPGFWETLDDWLKDRHGECGVSTIQKGRQHRIGYALSQAVIRERDQPILDDFFRSSGGRSAREKGPTELVAALRRWIGPSVRLSPTLRQAVMRTPDPDRDEMLGNLLVVQARSPHRTVSRPETVDRARLALLPSFVDDGWFGWKAEWYARAVDGVDRDTLRYAGTSFTVEARPGLSAYELNGDVPDVEDALINGLRAEGERLVVADRARTVLIAVENPTAGAWVAGDSVDTHEPVLVLAHKEKLSAVGDMLNHVGVGDPEPEDGPFDGWYVFRDVVFTDAELLRSELERLGCGVPVRSSPRPRLAGGLPIDPDGVAGGRFRYLVGGAPDLVLPVDFNPATPILLDGHRLVPPSSGCTMPLRSHARTEGFYELTVGKFNPRFSLHPARPRTASEAVDQPIVDADRQVMVPHSAKVYFFKADGSVVVDPEPDTPRWWTRRKAALPSMSYRVTAPRDAVWLAIEGDQVSIQQLRDIPPAIGRLRSDAKDAWSQFIMSHEAGRPHAKAWQSYRKAIWQERGWTVR
ncbi:hypothetical protein [Frankia sp. CiP3]|uniref:hypothetical protein n=1 Tax=Frankia sp. CiP3 TaxID=2880971 RepID=UPI001EF466EB|nr:hypothetical protein [Frankia sp. CiP3]